MKGVRHQANVVLSIHIIGISGLGHMHAQCSGNSTRTNMTMFPASSVSVEKGSRVARNKRHDSCCVQFPVSSSSHRKSPLYKRHKWNRS